jgi:hypothetical protein
MQDVAGLGFTSQRLGIVLELRMDAARSQARCAWRRRSTSGRSGHRAIGTNIRRCKTFGRRCQQRLLCFRAGPGLLPDRLIVVGGIELSAIATPSTLLNGEIHFSQAPGGNAQGYHLADAHHHVPGDHFDALRREFVAEPSLSNDFVDLVYVLGLIVTQEYREQKRIRGFLAVEHDCTVEKQRNCESDTAGKAFWDHGGMIADG